MSDNVSVSDNSENFDLIIFVKNQSDMFVNMERILISDKNKFSLKQKLSPPLTLNNNFVSLVDSNYITVSYISENIFDNINNFNIENLIPIQVTENNYSLTDQYSIFFYFQLLLQDLFYYIKIILKLNKLI